MLEQVRLQDLICPFQFSKSTRCNFSQRLPTSSTLAAEHSLECSPLNAAHFTPSDNKKPGAARRAQLALLRARQGTRSALSASPRMYPAESEAELPSSCPGGRTALSKQFIYYPRPFPFGKPLPRFFHNFFRANLTRPRIHH